jgi:hypothetical protein
VVVVAATVVRAVAVVVVVVAAIVAAAVTKMSAVPSNIEALVPSATALGQAWASECANELRAQERDLVGAWPGTVREARQRVLAKLPAARTTPPLDRDTLDLLARAMYDAARRSWLAISEPDLEP